MPPLVEVLNIRWCPARQCIYVRFQVRVDTLGDQLYFDATSVYKASRGFGDCCGVACACRAPCLPHPHTQSLYPKTTTQHQVNGQGMVYEHIIENVIRNDLMERPSIVSLFYTTRQILVGAPGAAPIPDTMGM